MSRRKPSIAPALCVSLIAHGLGLSGMAWWIVFSNPSPRLPALDRVKILAQVKPEIPPAPPAGRKPPVPVKFDKPQSEPKDDSGEAHGTGTANRSTKGDRPMQAEAGHEQADLMRDADQFADDAFLPASRGDQQANNAQPEKSPQQGAFAADSAADAKPDLQAFAPRSQEDSSAPGDGARRVAPVAPQPPLPAQANSGTPNPRTNLPVAQVATPKPMQKEIRGHRATQSDTESVAFSRSDSLTFHAGKVEGRQGLKVKSTMPRFGLASEVDIESLGGIRTILGAVVDADGNVLDVQILQSSGSANIDQDCRTAVWGWTLEPKKDKDGHPIDFTWVINFE